MARMILFVVFAVFLNNLAENTVEITYLQEQFSRRVGKTLLADEYREDVFAQARAAMGSSGIIKSPQYVLFVDRNPNVQLGTLLFINPLNRRLVVIGADKVSTGDPARRGYFITPLGFIENTPQNMSYRALGTRNSKGWRGLGVKGSRVWDFGWIETRTTKGAPYQIRLLLHATDPDYGEIRLGQVGSKGCIRVSQKFNSFLDYFGILDAEYEKSESGRAHDILLPEREPVHFPGRFILVGDSSLKE